MIRFFSGRVRTTLCCGLVLFALGLRLLAAPGSAAELARAVRKAAGSETLCRAALFFAGGLHTSLPSLAETVQPEPSEAQPAESSLKEPAPQPVPEEPPAAASEEEAAPVLQPVQPVPSAQEDPLGFTPGEAEAISLRGNCTYAVDKTALLLAPLTWIAAHGKPLVLIVHTHTSEAYTPTAEDAYTASADYRTLEDAHNMLAVGDALAEALEARGIGVLHDRTYNDYPSYNASYGNAKEKIESWLADYPSIVLVLDLHRDALEQPVREAVTINGEDCAKLMLVVGTDQGGLYHPYWQENLCCALKLQALLSRSCPGLCRQLNLRKERFNGQTSPGALIVEVGSTGNTLAEAKRSMPYLADAVAALLRAQGA